MVLTSDQQALLAAVNSIKPVNSSPQSEYFNDRNIEYHDNDDNVVNVEKPSCKSSNMKSFLLCFVIIILLYLVISSSCKYNNNNNNKR